MSGIRSIDGFLVLALHSFMQLNWISRLFSRIFKPVSDKCYFVIQIAFTYPTVTYSADFIWWICSFQLIVAVYKLIWPFCTFLQKLLIFSCHCFKLPILIYCLRSLDVGWLFDYFLLVVCTLAFKNLQISLIYLTLVSLLPSRPALTLIFTRSIYPFIWWFSRLKSSCWVISFLPKSYRFPFTFVLCPWLRIRAKFITFLSPGFQGPKCWTLSFAYCPIGLKFLSSFGHANQKAHCVTLPKRSKLPILKQAF